MSCEELNGQYVVLQQCCSNQGVELAQARAECERVNMQLAESRSKVTVASHGWECFSVGLYRSILWNMQPSNRITRYGLSWI